VTFLKKWKTRVTIWRLTEPEELLHHLCEACEGNIAAPISIQELKDMIQLSVIQLPSIQIENASLELLPSDRSGLLGVVLIENLSNRCFVARRH
jgi:hypothetical protein